MGSVRLSDIEGRDLAGPGPEPLGRVVHVLFHPGEPRAVGVMVAPPRIGGMVKRPDAYVGLADLTLSEDGASTGLAKLPPASKAEAALGHDPDLTVIWAGMPAMTRDGIEAGRVADVWLDPENGALESLLVSGGATSDIAVGDFTVPADEVEGYRDGAVRIRAPFSQVESSGGLAASTGKAAAHVKVRGGKVAAAAGEAVVKASGEAGRTIRRVKREGLGGTAKGMWAELTEAFREGYDEDDDEK